MMKKVSRSQVFSAKLGLVKAYKTKKASLGGLTGAKLKLDEIFGFEVSLTEKVTKKVSDDRANVEKAFAEVFSNEAGDMARLEKASKKASKNGAEVEKVVSVESDVQAEQETEVQNAAE